MKKKGFTLVELLVVIAILAILATVSIVGYTQFIGKSKQSRATSEAKELYDIVLANTVKDEVYDMGSNIGTYTISFNKGIAWERKTGTGHSNADDIFKKIVDDEALINGSYYGFLATEVAKAKETDKGTFTKIVYVNDNYGVVIDLSTGAFTDLGEVTLNSTTDPTGYYTCTKNTVNYYLFKYSK